MYICQTTLDVPNPLKTKSQVDLIPRKLSTIRFQPSRILTQNDYQSSRNSGSKRYQPPLIWVRSDTNPLQTIPIPLNPGCKRYQHFQIIASNNTNLPEILVLNDSNPPESLFQPPAPKDPNTPESWF
ncbi:hypothetical protein QE152_g21884 [Popillia japonica]|uniref:Uncharacterized protein n=1 Tax=Popillia japonica TaxID=7064 RepID=A0AAW1KM65_POPJA